MDVLKTDIEKKYNELVKKDNLLPIKVTNFYMNKIINEVNHIGIGGPLYRSVLPLADRWNIKAPVETRDYVEEYKHMPVENVDYIIQKYKDRVLVIITDICFAHCQYCFRTYNLSSYQNSNLKQSIVHKISILKQYLFENKDIKEVILSGGDPICIGYNNLLYVFEELKGWKIRLHTRAIVYQPSSINKKIIDLLKKYNIRLVFHINHPYEICEIVASKIREIDRAGIHMYAQFPLLKGINDHYLVLKDLLETMDNLHIRPLSIFIPDPITYSAMFRIPFDRINQIMDELNWNTPSWINSVRFTMDTTIGKVRRENIKSKKDNCIIFSRDSKDVEYCDIDHNINNDNTDISKLLWKTSNS